MGLPSGVQWAPFNVDADEPSGFAISEFSYGSSFVSWGNTDTHKPTGETTFAPWTWGTSTSGEPYGSSPGASLSVLEPENDIARLACGSSWRTPSEDEFEELLGNIDFINEQGEIISDNDKRIFVNGIRVVIMKSRINGNTLVFPLCGSGSGTEYTGKGAIGSYWSATLAQESPMSQARMMQITSSTVISNSARYAGRAIRPVIKPV